MPRATRRSRCSSPTRPARRSTTPARCWSRARPRSTTATSSPTASATRARASRSCPRPRACIRRSRSARLFDWYFMRIYVYVRPERVFVWEKGDFATRADSSYGAHMEEVRSRHSEEPAVERPAPEGGTGSLGRAPRGARAPAPDGRRSRSSGPTAFPCRAGSRSSPTAASGRIRLGELPDWLRRGSGQGLPRRPTPTGPSSSGRRTSRSAATSCARTPAGSLVPHRLIGGFELPKSKLEAYRVNFKKMRRFRKIAKRELAKRR